jgi:succinate-acetate transporter protein
MSTIEERRRVASAGVHEAPVKGVATRSFSSPSPPHPSSALAGFAGATFIVASNLAGWWGTPKSPLALAPFAAMFGGLAQFMAGMWAYRARDAIATLAHGTWGSFWLAYLIAMVTAYSAGRTILPLFKYTKEANKPGARPTLPIELEWAEPGVRMGQ